MIGRGPGAGGAPASDPAPPCVAATTSGSGGGAGRFTGTSSSPSVMTAVFSGSAATAGADDFGDLKASLQRAPFTLRLVTHVLPPLSVHVKKSACAGATLRVTPSGTAHSVMIVRTSVRTPLRCHV